MKKKLKHDIAFYTLWVIRLGAQLMPRRLGLLIFAWLGEVMFLFPSRDKRRTIANLTFIFGEQWSGTTIKKTARQVYRNLGMNLFDFIFSLKNPALFFSRYVKSDSLDEVRKAYTAGQGVIAIAAHTGCFEMLLPHWASNGFHCVAIGRHLFDPRFDKMITQARTGYNMEYVRRNENPRRIIRHLKEGKVFGVLIDQDTAVAGDFAPFLGKEAYTPSGAVKLAMKLQVPVFVVTTARQKDDTHRIFISEPLLFSGSDTSSNALRANLTRINDIISDTIKKYPTQWVWMHRRWKTEPKNNSEDLRS